MVVLKGYDGDREIWAVAKTYGSGETAENFICLVDPHIEIKKDYERAKNGFYRNVRKARGFARGGFDNTQGDNKGLPFAR